MELANYFKGKRVFITGHTGFKGSWLLLILTRMKAVVKGYSLEPCDEDLYIKLGGDKLCDSQIDDVCNAEKLKESILKFQPDIIFHLAAQPLVRYSYENPLETYNTNVIGTANLLDAVRFLKGKCNVVIITTDKVYCNKEWHYPYRETDRLGGYDPYSSSKACAELVVDSYRNSFFSNNEELNNGKSIATARAGNVIGGGDWNKDRIIPDIIKAFFDSKVLEVRNPEAVRPWQHVVEPLFGYLSLARHMDIDSEVYSKAWNFGPAATDVLTVRDLVNLSIAIIGKGDVEFGVVPKKPLHEAGLLLLDIANTINYLSWRPIFKSKEAIELTLNWYKKTKNGETALSACNHDIDLYLSNLGN